MPNRQALFHIFLAVLMVSTGSINTLAAKWADELKGEGGRLFDHPFVQATAMFIGEFLCLIAFFVIFGFRRYHYHRLHITGDHGAIDDLSSFEMPTLPRGLNPFVFLPPACCDILGTSIMYIGLNLTHASSFQMLRGAVIVFTGLLSVAFLRTYLQPFRWIGMIFVVAGLVVVGLADIMFGTNSKDDINGVITGDLLIVMAQIIVAIQMVYEQKYILKYDVPPLLAVGLEGLFGMIILSILMVPMYFIHVPATFSKNPFNRLEDVIDAFRQMEFDPLIIVALSATIISIAFFNFAGVSVTKELSATTRMVLDSVRTLVIWSVSLLIGWQSFIWLQIIGFMFLIIGMFIYNDILIGPWFRRRLIPWLSEHGCPTNCCINMCGLELQIIDDARRLVDSDQLHADDDDDHN